MAETEKPAPKAAEEKHDGLVAVRKGDQTLRVHPTALKDHEDAGWRRV